MSVTISLTAGELFDHGCWEAFCKCRGWTPEPTFEALPWGVGELLFLTLAEARDCGLLEVIAKAKP